MLSALNIIDRLTYDLDNDKIPVNIYIDLAKAFDTLQRYETLLNKLAYYGVRGKVNDLIRSYLTNRKQIVDFQKKVVRSINNDYRYSTGIYLIRTFVIFNLY